MLLIGEYAHAVAIKLVNESKRVEFISREIAGLKGFIPRGLLIVRLKRKFTKYVN